MAVWVGQTAFNSGVLDPKMNSRYDLDVYFQGLSRGDNVVSIPHGGVKRRDGMKYHATLTQKSRLIPFEFNTEQTYALAFSDQRIDVFKDGVLQTSVTVSVPWLEAELFDIDYAQSGDTVILVHENHPAQKLVRSSDTVWTLSAVSYVSVPQYDFDDASSPTPVSEVQDLTFQSNYVNGDTYRLELEGIETDSLTYSSSTSDNETRMQDALQDLVNTGDTGITVANTGGTVYRVTFAAASAKDWELLAGRVITAADTDPRNIVVTSITNGTAQTEDVWSATRGYPRSVTFHEGRLVHGGSRDRPSTIWMSRTFRPFDFNVAKSRADDAIDFTIETDQVHVIQQIVSARALHIFASGAEFYVPVTGITPENMAVQLQTNFGAKKIKPFVVDGATIFAQRLGSAIREFLFTDAESAYTADSVNIRAPSLFNAPVQMAVAQGTSNEDANYIYIVNGDGTMAVFNTLRSAEIAAWTKWVTRTGDKIISIITLDNVPWFCVQRSIDGSTVYYLEEANPDHRLDASTLQTQASSTAVTGLAHLNGEACRVRDGNIILENQTPAAGAITANIAVTTPEVGLDQEPNCDLMPLISVFRNGATAAQNKSLVRTSMDVKDSAGIYVQNKLQITREMGSVLGAAIPTFTGRHEVFHDGWYRDALTVNFKQLDPLPFEVLGIEVEVAQ